MQHQWRRVSYEVKMCPSQSRNRANVKLNLNRNEANRSRIKRAADQMSICQSNEPEKQPC